MSEALQVICLGLLGIAAILAIVTWIRGHYLEVQEGYAVPIKWFGSHRRLVYAGPHVLWPGEQAGQHIEIRPRETSLEVPEIRTHRGLPLTVTLRYRMSFAPQRMKPEELYYPQSEWIGQQRRLFMDGLQRVLEEFPRPASESQGEPATLAAIFSPFFSSPPYMLCAKLQQRILEPLYGHGIELLPDTLVMDHLDPPHEVTAAYEEMLHNDFDATAASRFVQTIREATPSVSAMDLAQLYNSILNNADEARTVFANGAFRPGMYLNGLSKRRPEPEGDTSEALAGNYPLTAEEMALLKSLPE